MKGRSFLKQVVSRVEVGRWPEGAARNLAQRRVESYEALLARREAHLLEVMRKRVTVVF